MIKTRIDLTKEHYPLGALTFTCSACGNLEIETDSNEFIFIPSILLGYQTKINDKTNLQLSVGAQYINTPSLQWKTDTEFPPPSYVRNKIDQWVGETEDYIDSLSGIVPTAKIGITYSF